MKIVINKIPLVDLLGYFSLMLYLTLGILETSFYAEKIPEIILKGGFLLAIVCLFLREMMRRKYTIQTFIAGFAILCLVVIAAPLIGVLSNVVFTLLAIYFLRDLPLDKLVKLSVMISVSLLVFIIISGKVGIITDYLEISGQRIRHYIGFRYSLFPSTILLNITSGIFFLRKETISFFEWLLLLFANIWVYYQTNSRLTFYSACLLLFIALLLKLFPSILERVRAIYPTLTLSFMFSLGISYYFMKNYNVFNSLHYRLNDFLGQRLYLANKSYQLYHYGLFGQRIEWVGNGLNSLGQKSDYSYLYVDNLYVQVLQRYGLVFVVTMVVVLTSVLVKIWRRNEWVLLIIMVSLAIHGVIDDLILTLNYNIFWLVIGILFESDYKINSEAYIRVQRSRR